VEGSLESYTVVGDTNGGLRLMSVSASNQPPREADARAERSPWIKHRWSASWNGCLDGDDSSSICRKSSTSYLGLMLPQASHLGNFVAALSTVVHLAYLGPEFLNGHTNNRGRSFTLRLSTATHPQSIIDRSDDRRIPHQLYCGKAQDYEKSILNV
jgi:hypothetical protein